jgi:hypothetical protein
MYSSHDRKLRCRYQHGYLKNLALAVSGNLDRHVAALWDHGHVKVLVEEYAYGCCSKRQVSKRGAFKGVGSGSLSGKA